MEAIWDFGIKMIIALQSLGTWLVWPMKGLSFLGQQEFYLLIAPALYWCFDAPTGFKAGAYLMFSSGINNFIKIAFLQPRPYWYSSQVSAYWAETSFGLPSGHAQNSVTFFGALGREIRKTWAYWAAGLISFMVGLSRIQLGAHFPTDVLAGWVIGIIILWLLSKLEKPAWKWLQSKPTWQQILAAFGVTFAVLIANWLVVMAAGNWNYPLAWQENIIRTSGSIPLISPLSLEGVFTVMGTLFGMSAGALWLADHGGFTAQTKDRSVLLGRFALGMAVLLILYVGLGALQPRSEDLVSYVFRYLRYGIIGAWVTAGAPLVFRVVKM